MDAPSHVASGRPPGASGIRAEAARHARESVRVLAEVARDPAALNTDRVAAAQTILIYAVGRKGSGTPATEPDTSNA